MAETEKFIYLPVKTEKVPGNTYPNIQGTPVPSYGIPFKDGHLEALSLAVLDLKKDSESDSSFPNLVMVSHDHRRSFELRFGEKGLMFVQDEYGNFYATMSVKGNNLCNPRAYKSDVAPSGFLVYGLQDSDAMVRVLKASNLLRKNHIDTEYIFSVTEPKTLLLDEGHVSIPELKKKIVNKVWDENKEKDSRDKAFGNKYVAREEIPDLSKALENMTFFFTQRAHLVSERFADLLSVRSKEQFIEIMGRVFLAVNKFEKVRAINNHSYTPEFFNVESDDDIYKYLIEYLPKRIAQNLAGIHNLELIHEYTHLGNISLAGGILDLDSIKGKPIDPEDPEFTEEKAYEDVGQILYRHSQGIADIFPFLKRNNFILRKRDTIRRFKDNFADEYISQRKFEKDPLKYFESMAQFYNVYSPKKSLKEMSRFMNRIIEITGFNYNHPENADEILDLFLEEDEKNLEDPIKARGNKDYIPNPFSRFYRFAKKRICDGLLKGHIKELTELDEKYQATIGHKAADALAYKDYLRVIRETLKKYYAFKKLKDENKKDFESRIIILERYSRMESAYNSGWEKDVTANILRIFNYFKGFPFKEDERVVAYYTALLANELGWDIIISEDIETLAEKFHEQDDVLIKKRIDDVFSEDPDKSKDEVLDIALETSEDFDADPKVRFAHFIVSYADQKIKDDYGDKLENIISKYDETTMIVIRTMFKQRELANIEEKINPDMIDQLITERVNERIDQVKQKTLIEL